jgi:2-keto-3-deoxy-L-rhamnonate aldolase RhmA
MEAKEMMALGFGVITIGSDASFILGTAQRTLAEMRG